MENFKFDLTPDQVKVLEEVIHTYSIVFNFCAGKLRKETFPFNYLFDLDCLRIEFDIQVSSWQLKNNPELKYGIKIDCNGNKNL